MTIIQKWLQVGFLSFILCTIALLKVVHSPPKKILAVNKPNFVTGNRATVQLVKQDCN